MQIEEVEISSLKPADYNPRKLSKEQETALKASLTRFGFVDPVVVNTHPERKNIIVGGHQRVKVWEIMGNKTVPVVFVDLEKEKERELNIRLNSNTGEWSWDLLKEFFKKDELMQWGFDASVLDMKFAELLGETVGEDEVPEAAPARTNLGDIYILGNGHRVICGDSTSPEVCQRLFEDKLADMIHTDPPYNVDYGVSKNPKHKIRTIENDKQGPEEWEAFCKALFGNFVAFNKGDVYMWGASGPEGMRMRLWLVEAGCHWSATIIWKKDRLVLTPANYQRMYEPAFYGWFGSSSYKGDRKQVEVWDLKRPSSSKLHPTMKPVELCERAILNSSRERDIVADFFLGSGSTLIACEKSGRLCYGAEIDPKYCDVIVKRYADYCRANGKDWLIKKNNIDISSEFKAGGKQVPSGS